MEYRKLGNSDLEVSVIGFGCWAMGKRYWGDDVDDELSIRAVHRALDLGVNLFDTADCYGSGHAETVLGQAIKGHRDEMIIATKGARVWDPETLEITGSDISAKHMIEACNASLKRLGIDYIDLYQVHTSYEGAPIEECAEALVKLQEEGKIRYIGVSNYPVEDIRRHMAKAPLASVQPPYNMLNRGIEKDLLPFCIEHNIGVLVYGPMAQGLLTGKYKKGDTWPETDLRHNNPRFHGERFERNLAAIERMKKIAERYGKTMSQLAVAWCLNQPGITVALCGTKRPEQIEETAGAAGWKLSEEDLAEIDRIIEETGAG